MALGSRIDRYVFSELVPPTLLGLALYTFVLMMNHFFIVAEKALSKNLGWDLNLRLFMVGIPEILVLSIPGGIFLIYFLNRVIQDSLAELLRIARLVALGGRPQAGQR